VAIRIHDGPRPWRRVDPSSPASPYPLPTGEGCYSRFLRPWVGPTPHGEQDHNFCPGRPVAAATRPYNMTAYRALRSTDGPFGPLRDGRSFFAWASVSEVRNRTLEYPRRTRTAVSASVTTAKMAESAGRRTAPKSRRNTGSAMSSRCHSKASAFNALDSLARSLEAGWRGTACGCIASRSALHAGAESAKAGSSAMLWRSLSPPRVSISTATAFSKSGAQLKSRRRNCPRTSSARYRSLNPRTTSSLKSTSR